LISINDTNAKLRSAALEARRSLTENDRRNASSKICERIIHSHEFMSARLIACYLPTSDEVDPTAVIQRAWCANKRVFVPVIDTHGTMNFCEVTPDTVITRNHYGIWEPVSGMFANTRSLDIVVTPLAAFDIHNNRIGMGGGYYDRCFRFLRNRRKWLRPKLIGAAFACQEAKNITPNSWDVPLYRVVTDAE
jgi:5-formyltetrahydrofolate cyclo-ligase